jgi:hypothetical protein
MVGSTVMGLGWMSSMGIFGTLVLGESLYEREGSAAYIDARPELNPASFRPSLEGLELKIKIKLFGLRGVWSGSRECSPPYHPDDDEFESVRNDSRRTIDALRRTKFKSSSI